MKKLNFDWTDVNADSYGNPRSVVFWVDIALKMSKLDRNLPIESQYNEVAKLCNPLGGRKHNTKAYGGGIVFQCYDKEKIESRILKAIDKYNTQ